MVKGLKRRKKITTVRHQPYRPEKKEMLQNKLENMPDFFRLVIQTSMQKSF